MRSRMAVGDTGNFAVLGKSQKLNLYCILVPLYMTTLENIGMFFRFVFENFRNFFLSFLKFIKLCKFCLKMIPKHRMDFDFGGGPEKPPRLMTTFDQKWSKMLLKRVLTYFNVFYAPNLVELHV